MRTIALEYAWPAPRVDTRSEREIELDTSLGVCCVWDAADGGFRAMWCASINANLGSPVFGLASPHGGPHKTIRAAVEEVRQFHPGTRVFRNGREVYPLKES